LSTRLPRAVTIQLTGTSSSLGFGCIPSWQGLYEQMGYKHELNNARFGKVSMGWWRTSKAKLFIQHSSTREI